MHKNKLIVVIVVLIVSFFVFRHCAKVGVSAVETVSSSLLYPLLRIQHVIITPITQWVEHRATVQELEGVIKNMRIAHEKLCAENSALKAAQLYENETRELRNFNKRYELHNGCMAQILARHFSAAKQIFLVDAGSRQGIKKDMVALYGNNIIGRVAQVYPWYCEVCLITDADCKVASSFASSFAKSFRLRQGFDGHVGEHGKASDFVKTTTDTSADKIAKSSVSGIHEGCNDIAKTTVRYVSHLEAVQVGDTVLSSGEGLVFPKGFALGKIIAAEKGELFYTIAVKSLLDLQTLQYCTLIAKEDIER